MDKSKSSKLIILVALIAIAVYLCIPKYEVYVSSDGSIVYRFNKITGRFSSDNSLNFGAYKPSIHVPKKITN